MTPPDRSIVEVIARTLRDEVYEFSKAGARRVAHAIADSLAAAGLFAAAEREAKLREAIIMASEVNRPFPPIWEDTKHNREIWEAGHGFGVLDAVEVLKRAALADSKEPTHGNG